MPEHRTQARRVGTHGRWVRPEAGAPGEPRWGHADGLQVGLAPLPGPRGLLRIYAGYLDHPRERLVNFIAVEPVPAGGTARGLSELERSALDDERGKRFWSVDEPDDPTPLPADRPAAGVVSTEDGIERLTVHVPVERFENGAHVHLRVSFRADRPHEVAVAAFRWPDSVELETCILTATMGNFARLRRLYLADGTVTAGGLWPDHAGDGFADHVAFPLARLRRRDGAVVVSATPDETSPEAVEYAVGTNEHWRYRGLVGVQTWRAEDPADDLVAQVNGRATYWASSSPIPGGVSFENFELVEPFRQGRELVFSIAPLGAPSESPDSL